MAELIRANIGGIDTVRSSMSEKLGALLEEEKKLQESIGRLGPMWEGEAHDTFQSDLTQYYQRIVAVDKKIADVIGFEERAVSEYGKAETEIDEKIGSL